MLTNLTSKIDETRAEIECLDREYDELRVAGRFNAAWQKRREYLAAQRRLWELEHAGKGERVTP